MRGPKINTHLCIHLMLGKDTKKHTLEKRASLTIGTGKKTNIYVQNNETGLSLIPNKKKF